MNCVKVDLLYVLALSIDSDILEKSKKMDNEIENGQTSKEALSSEKGLNRADFIQKVLKGAALAGGTLAAPKILDKFLIPPAFAANSSGCVSGETTTAPGPDHVSGTFLICDNPFDPGPPPQFSQTGCAGDLAFFISTNQCP